MSRPVDWAPLAEADPVPGDVVGLRALAKQFSDVASEIQDQESALRRLATNEEWQAVAAEKFRDSATALAGKITAAYGRFDAAGRSLNTWADDLEGHQSSADSLLSQAQSAQSSLTAAGQKNDTSGAKSAQDELNGYAKQLRSIVDAYDEDAQSCANSIYNVIRHDGLDNSWWDSFCEWVDQHAGILREISEWAGKVAGWLSDLSTILEIVGAFLPPPADVIVEAVAGVLRLASLACDVIKLACDATLAAAGDGSWLTVGLDGLATGLAVAGGKLGSKAEDTAGDLSSAAEKQGAKAAYQLAKQDAIDDLGNEATSKVLRVAGYAGRKEFKEGLESGVDSGRGLTYLKTLINSPGSAAQRSAINVIFGSKGAEGIVQGQIASRVITEWGGDTSEINQLTNSLSKLTSAKWATDFGESGIDHINDHLNDGYVDRYSANYQPAGH